MRLLTIAIAAVFALPVTAAPKHAFDRPADFVYQPPILGVPGR
jgi:hypothetical protein